MERCHIAQVGACHLQLMHHSFVVDGSTPLRYCFWLNCLLFLAGDIALNPGPACYPCTVCTRPVHVGQHGIQCDGCNKWTHASCSDVCTDLYNEMEAQVEFSWHCPSCLFQELPLFDVSDDSTSVSSVDSDSTPSALELLGASIQGVRIIHHNVQGIHSKITELTQWFEVCEDTATVFCFTETWLKPCSPILSVPGYTVLTSPILHRPGRVTSYLPGSCIIVSNFVSIERPSVCERLEKSCHLLNLVCCFINCNKGVRASVVSVYRSPSTDFQAGLIELQSVISELLLCCQHVTYYCW